ncbi:unknown [Ruminococcus sp. CAG:353]|nr:unknown [Ruminococcus sp. CAG:353]
MAKSNFEPYAYLYDNGFFDPIEVIVDDNEIRVPETIVPENIYYTPSKSASKNSKPDKYENFLKRLYEIWRYGCDGLEFVQKIWLPTLLICLMAGAADAKYLKSNPKYLIILIIIFSIISLITIIYAIWDMNGGKMLKSLLLKNQGLCKTQTLYTLNFNYDVIM